MTVIYLTEYNCRRYAVTFENRGYVKVQKFNDMSDDENNLLYIKPLKTFLSKSEVCDKTMMSGAFDKTVNNANTISLKIGEKMINIGRFILVVIRCVLF